MSAIAKYLSLKGYSVSGSDVKKSDVTESLIKQNVTVYYGGNLNEVTNSDVIVYSSAVKNDDAELLLAKKLKKAIYSRSRLLSEIIKSFKNTIGVAGSHGKTTVTSMIAHIYNREGVSFTSFIGGDDNVFTNMRTDLNNKNVIAEICEYKKNIDFITVDSAVLLNVDNDHLDCYCNLNDLKTTFNAFLNRAKIKVINADDKRLCSYCGAVTFGIKNKADFIAKNLKEVNQNYSFDLYYKENYLTSISLPISGLHNVYNALAAISVCYVNGISVLSIKCALENYTGVKRRFEFITKINGTPFYADYCHHPNEIASLIKTADAKFKGNVLYVFQPHTFSRTKNLIDDFVKVFNNKSVIIFKTYAARENYDYLGSAELLAKKCNSLFFNELNYLINNLNVNSLKYNAVFILGAGDLYDKFINKYK